MRRVIVVLAGLAVLVVMSLALGRAHPFGNPRAATMVPTDAPSTLLLEHALIPVEVKSVLRQKCADCHSTQTRWPWYGRFAPVSWLMESDITGAQEQMNLSQWESLPDEEILLLRAVIAGVARAHVMPPLQYRLAHGDVALTDDDIKLLSGLGARRCGKQSRRVEKDSGRCRAWSCGTREAGLRIPLRGLSLAGAAAGGAQAGWCVWPGEWYRAWIHLFLRAKEGGAEMG